MKHIILILFIQLSITTNSVAQKKHLTTNFGDVVVSDNVIFSQNEKGIVSGCNYYTLKFRDIKTGREIKTLFGNTDYINNIALSPNRKIIAVGRFSKIELYNAKTKKLVRTFRQVGSLNCIAFSLDSKVIACGNHEKIMLCDIKKGRIVKIMRNNFAIESLVFSPLGNLLISLDSFTIKFWDINTGKVVKTINKQPINNILELSLNGKVLVYNDRNNSIVLRNAETSEKIRVLRGHSNNINSLSISSDGKMLVSGSRDSTLKIWNIETGKLIKTFVASDAVKSASFSSNGKLVLSLSADKTIVLWDISTGEKIITLGNNKIGYSTNIAFSPDGKMLAHLSNKKTVMLWDLETGSNYRKWKVSTINSKLAFSPDGKILAIVNSYRIKLYDIETGKEIRSLSGYVSNENSIVFSPNGKIIATGSDVIEFRDTETGKIIRTIEGHSRSVSSLAFSPNGKILISSSFGEIKLWDTESGVELRTINEPIHWIKNLSFSPDGKKFVSRSQKTIKLWDTQSGKQLKEFVGHNESINCVVFSPDGKILASSSKNSKIKLWNIKTGREIRTINAHTFLLNSIAFSPNGKIIASSGYDGIIKLWDTETGELLATRAVMNEHNNYDWIVYTPDGKYDGINCHKYLHYVSKNKISYLPPNDPNRIPNLLNEIINNSSPIIKLNHNLKIVTRQTTFELNFSVVDNDDILKVSINNEPLFSTNGQYKKQVHLNPGVNTFEITAIDKNINIKTKQVIIVSSPTNNIDTIKNYALFFAIDDYPGYQNNLANPIRDAEAISKKLRDDFGFETEIVRNPDKRAIFEKLIEYQQKKYGDKDQLLIYYSGFGKIKEQEYFLPQDAVFNEKIGSTYFSFSELSLISTIISCKHILLILDVYLKTTSSCDVLFGENLQASMPNLRPPNMQASDIRNYVNSELKNISRLSITAYNSSIVNGEKHSKITENFIGSNNEQGLLNLPKKIIDFQDIRQYITENNKDARLCTFKKTNKSNDTDETEGNFIFLNTLRN